MTTPSTTALATRPNSDAADRGTTTLANRVVEKIAAQAALEVPQCLGLHRRIVGISTGRTMVDASAVTDGSITALTLGVGIAYPAPVTTTTRQIRSHVTQRVESLCGLTVDHIDITVGEVTRPTVKERRVR